MKINPIAGNSMSSVALSGAQEPAQPIMPRTIKMNVNRTVNRFGEAPPEVPAETSEAVKEETPEAVEKLAEAVAEKAQETKESGISDTGVQANAEAEVTAPLSPQLAAIAKQRRALQVKEKELAEREKALEGNTRAELEAEIKANALGVLQRLGVTYDQLTNEILGNQGNYNPEIEALKAKVKALEEGIDQKFLSANEEQEVAVLDSIADEIDELIKDSDEYETVRTAGAQEAVLRHIYNTYKKTGKVLDTEAALKFVEQTERVKRKAELAKLKWVKSEFLPPSQAEVTATPQQGMKTLTNNDQARPTLSRRQRAINAALGQK